MTTTFKRKAFTLIELLIVIAIIGILFIVLVSKVDFATDKAKMTGVQTDFRSFQVAFEQISRENAGFNTLGWDTGDIGGLNSKTGANEGISINGTMYTYTNAAKDRGDKVRNSYDVGDTNLNGEIDANETWTGRKIYTENWTSIYTLDNPCVDGDEHFNDNAVIDLENAINKNLDPKLHITIDPDTKKITMANGYHDPWTTEYHGFYLSNAAVDGQDRGAILMYSNGPNKAFGSAQIIANGKVSITIPQNNIQGQDDLSILTIYTYFNGYGEVKTTTSGFSQNQGFLSGGNNSNLQQELPETPVQPDTPETPSVSDIPWENKVAGLYESGGTYTTLLYDWDSMKEMGWIDELDRSASGYQSNLVGDLILPNTVNEVTVGFYNCTGLTGIVFPEGISSIREGVVQGCANLNHIVLPKSLQSCVKLGNGLSNIQNVYYAGNSKEYLQINWQSCYIPYYSRNVKIHVNNNELLTNIVVDSDITKIPYGLFEYYQYVERVEIKPNAKVDSSAFASSSVKYVIIDGNLIGSSVFSYCNMEELHINSSINVNFSFQGSSVKKVYVGENVKSFGNLAFFMVNGIQEVIYEGTMDGWLSMEFSNYADNPLSMSSAKLIVNGQPVTDLVIPDNVTKIGSYVFEDYLHLTSIVLGKNVVEIENSAFKNANNVTSITFNNKLTTIGDAAFMGLNKVAELNLPDSVEVIQSNAFRDMRNVTSLHLGENVKTIGSSAFYNLNITSIIIPDSVTTIGSEAFNNCTEVQELIIGAGVVELEEDAFLDLNKIVTIKIKAVAPPEVITPFASCERLTTIIVPSGSVNAYKTAQGWTEYKDMIIGG